MAIDVWCECGRRGQARDEFAGRRARCPSCGRTLQIGQRPGQPQAGEGTGAGADFGEHLAEALQQPLPLAVTEYLDPPAAAEPEPARPPHLHLMLEALLAPQSIQWMLVLGGGLAVLGLLIWLTTLGVFRNPYVLAAVLGAGSLGVLAAGWLVTLKTRYRVAGQALTFLGCVVAPLNLWFYQAQGLLTVDGGLWFGGLVCCLLYVATVYVLRDPLFIYAVEAGITLTIGLLLAELCRGVAAADLLAYVSLVLMVLGLVSIHAERALAADAATFDRRRFGLPLFWSGHAQVAASLAILLATQVVAWLASPAHPFLRLEWPGNLLTQNALLAGGLWLAGAYAYLYSDLVVRRVGVYTYLAASCFLLAEVTLVGLNLQGEWLIAVMALTALAATLTQAFLAGPSHRIVRTMTPLALILNALPVVLGLAMHFRAVSQVVPDSWKLTTGWPFVAAMVLVAACNRVSAWFCRDSAPRFAAAYFFGSAAAAVVAVAGVLRVLAPVPGLGWLAPSSGQAPILMLMPMVYLAASRLWRGRGPERPLAWVAQTATAVILFGVLVAAVEVGDLKTILRPISGQAANLAFGLVFAEAAVFYALAAAFRRRAAHGYLAATAACGALWQLLGYWIVPGEYQTMLYAVLGLVLLVSARGLGIENVAVYRPSGAKGLSMQGRGSAAMRAGNAVFSLALLASLLQGLSHLAARRYVTWSSLDALILTAVVSAAAIVAASGPWRRLYVVSTVVLAGLVFLTLTLQSRLTGWQKLEIFCVAAGVLMVALSYVARFRETENQPNDVVTLGLCLGSVLATVPLLTAAIYYQFVEDRVSYLDVWVLLTVSIAMLATGFSWQVLWTTVCGGGSFLIYLTLFLVDLSRLGSMALGVGVYLAIAGSVVFGIGIGLSVYREKLLQLPEKIAHREGVFKVLSWR